MPSHAKILVADDETHVIHILSLKLGAMGCDVQVARDGQEALDLTRQTMPDLIVTDYQMPLMSGYELATTLFQDEATRHLPLIMLTARGHKLSKEELAKTNIVELMDKPFSVSALSKMVGQLLAHPCKAGNP